MRTLLATLFLFCAVGAFAQATNRITAKITVTTATSNNFAFTLNADTRTFTNAVTAAASQIITNHTVAGSASNFYYHVVASRFSRVQPLNYTNGSNVIYLRGALGQAMSVTILSNWATVEYSTQVFSSGMIDVRVPLANEEADVQTKVASELVTGINAYTTNAFATNSPALTNHLSLGPQVQRASNKVFEASHITGGHVSNSFFTNITRANIGYGRITNALIHGGTATGLVTYALSAPGTGTESMQLGSGAYAAGDYSFVAGVNATNGSGGDYSVLLGNESKAEGLLNVVLGYGSWSSNDYAVILGPSLLATNDFIVLIAPPSGGAMNSASFGPMADNQVWIGTASESVWIPGATHFQKSLFFTNAWATNIVAGIGGGNARITNAAISASGITATNLTAHNSLQTNAVVKDASFPGTNRFSGAVYHTVTNATGMANGDVLLDFGVTRVNHVLSGNTATINICGIKSGADGRSFSIIKTNIYNIVIRNLSGAAGTAASERIYTGTGGDRTYTNSHLKLNFTYDATLAAWILEDPL